jgi:hypothetical protein
MKSPLLACLTLAVALLLPPAAVSQVSLSVSIAPPPLPLYAQPPVPGEGYIWMPGYWAWDDTDAGYYWVPGTWVLPPGNGDLWTPGYWGLEGAGYVWHLGYWGSRVGFYGGINYGFGYFGSGYQGGRWDHGGFRYNRAVSNVGQRVVRNVYSAPPVNPRSGNRVSFNGGHAGAAARPSAGERQFLSGGHPGPKDEQLAHEAAARAMPTQRATGPHGVPQVAATPRPSEFTAPRVEHMRAAPPMRPEAPHAPGAQPPQGEPHRGPGAGPQRPQPEGPPRKER